jgi:hypothetical protein
MRRETPEERVRREQRELMARLNAERDARLTTAQQNQMRMAGSQPMPQAPAVPQVMAPETNAVGRLNRRYNQNRLAQIDAAVDRAAKGKPR